MTLSNQIFFIDKNTGDPRMFDSVVVSTGEVVEREYNGGTVKFMVFVNHATQSRSYVLMDGDSVNLSWCERQGYEVLSE